MANAPTFGRHLAGYCYEPSRPTMMYGTMLLHNWANGLKDMLYINSPWGANQRANVIPMAQFDAIATDADPLILTLHREAFSYEFNPAIEGQTTSEESIQGNPDQYEFILRQNTACGRVTLSVVDQDPGDAIDVPHIVCEFDRAIVDVP